QRVVLLQRQGRLGRPRRSLRPGGRARGLRDRRRLHPDTRRARARRRRDLRGRRPVRRGPRGGAAPHPQGALPETGGHRELVKAGIVSIIGRPNAGKSTLLNRIVGEKIAIVSDKPQTTRTRILGTKNYPDGQVAFVDTRGIHRPLHRMNVRMVDAAVETLREVDAVMLVHDASTRVGHGDEYVSRLLKNVTIPVVLVLNKIDLISKPRLLPVIEQLRGWHEFSDIVPVSAATGDGIDTLERLLLAKMPEGEPLYPDDFLTDQPHRVIAPATVRDN